MNNIILLQDSSRQSTCPGTRSASTAPPPSASRLPGSAGDSTPGQWTGGWWPPTPTPWTTPASRAPPSASTSSCSPSTSGARNRSCGPRARRTCRPYTGWRYPWSALCCSATWPGGETPDWWMITKLDDKRISMQAAISSGRLGSCQRRLKPQVLESQIDAESDVDCDARKRETLGTNGNGNGTTTLPCFLILFTKLIVWTLWEEQQKSHTFLKVNLLQLYWLLNYHKTEVLPIIKF